MRAANACRRIRVAFAAVAECSRHLLAVLLTTLRPARFGARAHRRTRPRRRAIAARCSRRDASRHSQPIIALVSVARPREQVERLNSVGPATARGANAASSSHSVPSASVPASVVARCSPGNGTTPHRRRAVQQHAEDAPHERRHRSALPLATRARVRGVVARVCSLRSRASIRVPRPESARGRATPRSRDAPTRRHRREMRPPTVLHGTTARKIRRATILLVSPLPSRASRSRDSTSVGARLTRTAKARCTKVGSSSHSVP